MNFSICLSNANGLRPKLTDLRQLLTVYSIVAINESKLSPTFQLPSFAGFTVFRSDRNQHGGGVALFVNSVYLPTPIAINQSRNDYEAIGVEVKLSNGQSLAIVTAYFPPGVEVDVAMFADIENRFEHSILLGDFNAKSPVWGLQPQSNRSGELLADYLDQSNFIIANDSHQPTHYDYRGNCDVLDLVLVSQTLANKLSSVDVIDPLANSDHCCVEVRLGLEVSSEPNERLATFKFNRADWQRYSSMLSDLVSDAQLDTEDIFADDASLDSAIQSVDEFAVRLESVVMAAATATIPMAKPAKRSLQLSAEVRDLIQQRKRLIRQRQRLARLFGVEDANIRRQVNFLTRTIKRLVDDEKLSQWQRHTASLNFRDSAKLWRTIRGLKKDKPSSDIPTLIVNGAQQRTSADKAETFKTHLSEVFQDHEGPEYDAHWRAVVCRYVASHPSSYFPQLPAGAPSQVDYVQPISVGEVSTVLRWMANKAPGPDGVCTLMLRHSPVNFKAALVKLFNACYRLGYHPKAWKLATVVMIPKPGKNPTLPTSYRPISLLSVTGKLMERVVTQRLLRHLEQFGLINDFQSGFRQQRQTVDHLLRLSESVSEGFNRNQFTVAVFLDVEKAFDRVWLDGLRYKLKVDFGLDDQLIRWISSYLNDRQCQIRVNGQLSRPFSPAAGVPQGSVIAPVLFNLFANGMPFDQQRYRMPSQFADDIALWTTSFNVHHAADQTQSMLDQVANYCTRWRIKLNATKTQMVIFEKSGNFNRAFRRPRHRQATPVRLTLGGHQIEPSRCAKFLGVTFDSSLSFNSHVDQVVTRCRQRLNILKALRGTDWGSGPETITGVYKQFIKPVLLYGSAAFLRLSTTQAIRLQRVENWALRIAMRLPIYTPTEWLHENARLPFLHHEAAKGLLSYVCQMLESNDRRHAMVQGFLGQAIVNNAANRQRQYQTPIGALLDVLESL